MCILATRIFKRGNSSMKGMMGMDEKSGDAQKEQK
jgi:hypothetical protein